MDYKHLIGPATAAHFHSPAMPSHNTGMQIGLHGSLVSPIQAPAKLTPQQITELEAGQWFFNIHTHKNPGGEIRGQVICH